VASDDIISDGVTGFIVDARNPESLAERLRWLKQHPDEGENLGRQALAEARNRTWDALIDAYLAVVPDLQPTRLSAPA
jgi:glycosyltransferase involved in cell wall biosynthesis